MRDRVRLEALVGVLVLLVMSGGVLAAAKAGASQAAKGSGGAKACELCQKPIGPENEATLKPLAGGSVHHYACIECALVSARDYVKGDLIVRTKSAATGTPIEWTRRAGKWHVSPESAVVLSLPAKHGDCRQDHLAFKDAAEFDSYAKTHANATGHKALSASQVGAILQAGKQPAPKETTCPVMRHVVHPNAQTAWTVYEGKTYYFCCAGCKPKFTGDPAGYLSGAIKPPTDTKGMKGGACGSHGDKGCGGNDTGCAGESKAAPQKPAAAHGTEQGA